MASAYLHGQIDCQVHIEQPTDLAGIEEMPGHVCLLLKSMYVKKQTSRIWGSPTVEKLVLWGFKTSITDERLLFLSLGSKFILLVIFVDVFAFSSNLPQLLGGFKTLVSGTFDVKYFRSFCAFIDWELRQEPDGRSVRQRHYIDELLEKDGVDACNGTLTSMSTVVDLRSAMESEDTFKPLDHNLYQKQIGKLLYLSTCTQPDTYFAVCAVAQSLHAPTERLQTMLRHVKRYLLTTKHLGLKFSKTNSDLDITAYLDSHFVGCRKTRHSLPLCRL